MTAQTKTTKSDRPIPQAASKLSLWFPAGEWLRSYKWGSHLTPDIIAAISVAALLIPESMGYATVAGVPVEMGLYAAPLAKVDPNVKTGDYEAIAWQFGHKKGKTKSKAKSVPGVIIYRFSTPLIFSNAEAFKKTGKALLINAGAENDMPHTLVIDCEEISYVDTTGADAVKNLFEYAQRYQVELFLARVHSGTHHLLELSGVLDDIGEDRIFHTIRRAVETAVSQSASQNKEETT